MNTRCNWCGCTDSDEKPNGDHEDCAEVRARRAVRARTYFKFEDSFSSPKEANRGKS